MYYSNTSWLQIYIYLLNNHTILKYFIIKFTLKKLFQENKIKHTHQENMQSNIFSHIGRCLNKVINYLCAN